MMTRPRSLNFTSGVVVLLGEEGGGDEDGHLGAPVGGDEGGAHGHFRLAEAHVAAHHPVHDLVGAEVGDDGVDGGLLVGRLFEGEGGGEGGVGHRVEGELASAGGLAPGVDVQQLGGHVVGLLRRLALGLFPLSRAQFVQGGVFRGGAGVTADEMEAGDGHVEGVAVGVLQGQELAFVAAHFEAFEAPVAAHAVVHVDHGGALGEVGEVADEPFGVPGRAPSTAVLARPLAEQLSFGDHFQGRFL